MGRNALLNAYIPLTIVVSLKAVGIILVIAMLVTPGAVAYLWTDKFDRMLVISVSVAVSSTILGIFASYHMDASTGACIVLVQAFVFVSSLIFAPKHGLWVRKLRAKKAR